MQALEVSGVLYQLIPELKEGKGVTQNQIYHAFDVLGHNLAAYSASLPEAALRWSALLHDVGKPRAKDETGRMIGHDAIGAAMSAEILTRLGADNHTVRLVHDLIARHMFDPVSYTHLRGSGIHLLVDAGIWTDTGKCI